MKRMQLLARSGLLLTAAAIISACAAPRAAAPAAAPAAPAAEPAKATEAPAAAAAGKTKLTLWYHGAGNDVEKKILTQIVDDFNASQDKFMVERQDFPQKSYND